MHLFISEFLGTAILLLLGNGVVANVVLKKTYGHNAGIMAITIGWAMAVFVGVYISAAASGAHLNPAVTISLAFKDGHWANVPLYLVAQFLGAMFGSLLIWFHYKTHFDATEDAAAKMACFCTSPAIPNKLYNLLSEITGGFVLVIGILFIAKPQHALGALDALPVALLVLAIGISLGGTTGYAINPARDLGPRIVHALLPINNKANSNWAYSWIPVMGPIIGGMLAVVIFKLL
ncbi:MAG: MIP/aquaporin family protein [Ferruginibacter sp.]